jgi:outer membrane protein W
VTVSLQRHFLAHGSFRPYRGVLGAYDIVTGDDPPKGCGGDIDFGSHFGVGAGAAVDLGPQGKPWFVNLAVK